MVRRVQKGADKRCVTATLTQLGWERGVLPASGSEHRVIPRAKFASHFFLAPCREEKHMLSI